MNKRLPSSLLLLIVLLVLTGCQTYTARQAKESIVLPREPGEKVVTKFSTLQAEQLAKQELSEQKAQTEAYILELKNGYELQIATLERTIQELRQEVVSLSASLEEKNAMLGETLGYYNSLDETTASLTARINELRTHLDEQLALTERLSRELADERSNSEAREQALLVNYADQSAVLNANIQNLQEIATLKAQLEEKTTALESIQNRYKTLEENATDLSYRASELQALLDEQLALVESLKLQMADEKKTAEGQVANLTLTLQNLQDELSLLKAQLEEKTLTLEERLNLERQREEEALRIAAQKQAELKRQTLEEEQKKAELEALYSQLPPISELTFPRQYKTDEPTITFTDSDQLHVMMLPLDDSPWYDRSMVERMQTSISDLNYPVIMVTGHVQNLVDLVKAVGRNAVLVEGGAIITSLPIIETEKHSIRVQFSDQKTVRLAIASLPEYEVFKAFESSGDWKSIQKSVTPERTKQVEQIIGEGVLTEPTILGASLYEPSYQDWNTFSPITYRQMDYLWPLTAFLEDQSFFDVYRTTHFSSATDAGNTFHMGILKERLDYLFSRKVLPLNSTILTFGESVSDDNGVARFGLIASFLIP